LGIGWACGLELDIEQRAADFANDLAVLIAAGRVTLEVDPGLNAIRSRGTSVMSSRRNAETRFTKIKFDGSKVRLEYEVIRPGGGDPDEYSLLCADLPLVDFRNALRALVDDICVICEFPSSETPKVKVLGCSLTYKDGVLGAVLTATKDLMISPAPLILNTPHLPEKPYSDSGGSVLPANTVRRVRALCVEAQRYLDGDREQGSLFRNEAVH
jgi:hypothetical protein